jgi:hypothetical protein
VTRDRERSPVHERWARLSMEGTVEALASAESASRAEAQEVAWALAVARGRLAVLGETGAPRA